MSARAFSSLCERDGQRFLLTAEPEADKMQAYVEVNNLASNSLSNRLQTSCNISDAEREQSDVSCTPIVLAHVAQLLCCSRLVVVSELMIQKL